MRGRNNNGGGGNNNNRKGPNPLTRTYDNGPDVKIRGTAAHVYEKYLQLARDAGSRGDRVMQENYLQHAEHYYRILMAQGAQLGGQQQQQYVPQQGQPNGNGNGDGRAPQMGGGNGNEGYHHQQQPQQPVMAGSAPSFSLADADDMDDGDDAG